MERQRLRVLIADDCKDSVDSLVVLVNLWGHETRAAYDGADALEMAADFQPDVVLLDIAMPKINGFDLAKQLRQTQSDALLVAITGFADAAHRQLWEKAFDRFLIKPVEPEFMDQLLMREQRRLVSLSAAHLATPRRVGIALPAGEAVETYLIGEIVEVNHGATKHVPTA